jgi:hypothetical protein
MRMGSFYGVPLIAMKLIDTLRHNVTLAEFGYPSCFGPLFLLLPKLLFFILLFIFFWAFQSFHFEHT